MKKIILILVLLFFIIGCAEQVSEEPTQIPTEEPEIEQPLEEEIPEEVDDTITEEPQVNEPIEEPQQEIETKLELIYPKLTYPDAYNGPLYATSEQVGNTAPTEQYWENMDRNGVNYLISMFQIAGKPSKDSLVSSVNLGYVVDWVQKHPYRVIPFFNPGIGGVEVEPLVGNKLTSMYKETLVASREIVGNSFIKGFGELETQMWDMRHNDPKFMQMVSLASENDLVIMFHPVSNRISDVKTIIEKYPNTIFLIHMYREHLLEIRNELANMMKTHDNLYFSIDVAHIIFYDGNDIIYTYNNKDINKAKNRFISTFDSKYKGILNDAVKDYKPFVDAVPDKIMWGTESGPLFNWEPEVYDRMIKISRLFIGKLDKEHQEAVGYKNALRVFGEGVKLNKNLKVVDASSWQICTGESTCDESCKNSNVKGCLSKCLIRVRCNQIMEEDIDDPNDDIDVVGEDTDEADEFCAHFDGDEEECLSHSDKCKWSTQEGGTCVDK